MNFEEFATNHENHPHCIACSGCIVNPDIKDNPVWCITCKHRIEEEARKRPGVPLPWKYGFDYEKQSFVV